MDVARRGWRVCSPAHTVENHSYKCLHTAHPVGYQESGTVAGASPQVQWGVATDTGPRHAECNDGWIWYSEKRAQAQGLDSVGRGERELHAGAGTVTSVQAFGLCNVSNPIVATEP